MEILDELLCVGESEIGDLVAEVDDFFGSVDGGERAEMGGAVSAEREGMFGESEVVGGGKRRCGVRRGGTEGDNDCGED